MASPSTCPQPCCPGTDELRPIRLPELVLRAGHRVKALRRSSGCSTDNTELHKKAFMINGNSNTVGAKDLLVSADS